MLKCTISSKWAFVSMATSMLGLLGCSGETTGANEPEPTYYRDIAPLVEAKCANCHAEGGIAPFALGTYDQLKALAPAVRASVMAKTMPPWPASNDCTDYLGNRSLSDEQIDQLVQWIDKGMLEGDPSDTPQKVDSNARKLSRVDFELPMPVAYTPKVSPDEYRCFFVDWPETETAYVTGFGVKPGYEPIVHHLIAFLARPDVLASFEALEAEDAEPGWTCYGGPGGNAAAANWVGGWAPGAMGADFPAGTGIEIPPGSKLIVQMHYNTSTAAPMPDQSSVLLKVDKTVEKRAATIPFTNISWVKDQTMNIPPHTNDVTHAYGGDPTKFMNFITGGAIPSNVPLTIYTAGAHMHTFGRSIGLEINRASGETECLVDIPQWNFHWQGQYSLAKPKIFEPGDMLAMKCTYDNPTMNELNWGEGTGDEMCLGVYYVTE
jgi:hypothetical protein